MNFNKKREPIVDLNKLARNIAMHEPEREIPPFLKPDAAHSNSLVGGHIQYAPPAVREEYNQEPPTDIQHIRSFAELPAKEIDEVVAGARAEFEELDRRAEALKSSFHKHAQKLLDDFEKLRGGMKLSSTMFDNLREEVMKLDAPKNVEHANKDLTTDE